MDDGPESLSPARRHDLPTFVLSLHDKVLRLDGRIRTNSSRGILRLNLTNNRGRLRVAGIWVDLHPDFNWRHVSADKSGVEARDAIRPCLSVKRPVEAGAFLSESTDGEQKTRTSDVLTEEKVFLALNLESNEIWLGLESTDAGVHNLIRGDVANLELVEKLTPFVQEVWAEVTKPVSVLEWARKFVPRPFRGLRPIDRELVRRDNVLSSIERLDLPEEIHEVEVERSRVELCDLQSHFLSLRFARP